VKVVSEYKKGHGVSVKQHRTEKYMEGTVSKVSNELKQVYINFDNGEKGFIKISSTRLKPSVTKEIPENTIYFAYGSNMDLRQMRYRCPDAKLLGAGILPRHKFIINSRGVATLIPENRNKVYGLIFYLNEDDEDTLDRYEGVKGGYYYKDYIDIASKNGNIKCLIYFASDTKPGNPREGYLEKIINAVKKYFPKNMLKN